MMPTTDPPAHNLLGDPQLPLDFQLQINVDDIHLWFTAAEIRGLGISPASSIYGGLLGQNTPVPPQLYLHLNDQRHLFEENDGFKMLDQLCDQGVISSMEHTKRTAAYHEALDEWEAENFPETVQAPETTLHPQPGGGIAVAFNRPRGRREDKTA